MMSTRFGIAYFPLIALGAPIAFALNSIGCTQEGPMAYPPVTGGNSATAGSGGSSAGSTPSGGGTSAAAGTGGSGGAACVGEPPVTPNKVCTEIVSQKKGDGAFTVTSPDFTNCGEMPKALTCDGNDFGTGASPKLDWTGVPATTKSFAVVFKDISLSNEVATERFGYHWVMWDIPAATTGLPAGMTGGYQSVEVPGAHQWSSLGSYGFFPPCPNPFRDPPMFMCSLTQDSYSFTVYALPVAKLTDIPAAIDTGTSMPAAAGWNWVVNMAHYIESLDAVAVAEYRGTSKAWAKAFVPPNAAEFPCSTASGAGGAGGAGAGGASTGGASNTAGTAGTSSAGNGGSTAVGGSSGSTAMCLK